MLRSEGGVALPPRTAKGDPPPRIDGVMPFFGVEFFPLISTRLVGEKELLYSRHINKAHHSRTSPFGSARYANVENFAPSMNIILECHFPKGCLGGKKKCGPLVSGVFFI